MAVRLLAAVAPLTSWPFNFLLAAACEKQWEVKPFISSLPQIAAISSASASAWSSLIDGKLDSPAALRCVYVVMTE